MNIIEELRGLINSDTPYTIQRPKNENHGELAINLPMVLNGDSMKIAEDLSKKLQQSPLIKQALPVSPGFINLIIEPHVWIECMETQSDFNIGLGERVLLEFVSANPTGPLHIGHARGAVYGDTLARLMRFCGYHVDTEYLINDAGSQVDHLVRSVRKRYLEACGYSIEFSEDDYQGDYLIPIGETLKKIYSDSHIKSEGVKWIYLFKEFSIYEIMNTIKDDLISLGVRIDNYTSERKLPWKIPFEKLYGNHDIYRNENNRLLFRSTKYGDSEDRFLDKEDQSFTYFASDIAYHYDKIRRGYPKLINIFGQDHSGYISRIKGAVESLSDGEVDLDIITVNLVNLMNDSEIIKMSKRAGDFIALRNILEVVGPDVLRFSLLMRKSSSKIDFDPDKFLERSMENPYWSIQYAHSRICSLLKKEIQFKNPKYNEEHIYIIRRITEFPDVVKTLEPHLVVFYLINLASDFHSFYSRCKILDSENSAGIEVSKKVKTVLKQGLNLLGIKAVDSM